MKQLAVIALVSCLYTEAPPERAHVYSCHGVGADIFLQLCVRPGETPEDEWARVTARTSYDCHCTLSCIEERQTCTPYGEP